MKFNRLRNAKLNRPTAVVPVPELKDWIFDKDEVPELKVRGLTSNQLFSAKSVSQENSPLRALSKAISGGQQSEMVDAFKLFTAGSDSTTTELTYRIELCVKGVIDNNGAQVMDYSDAAKLSEHFPNVFIRITEKISAISGDSSIVDPGK